MMHYALTVSLIILDVCKCRPTQNNCHGFIIY